MMSYIVEEPTDPNDTGRAYKFPFVISEMMQCEPVAILEKIVASEDLLRVLFGFFEVES
jgi:hypothetical protein